MCARCWATAVLALGLAGCGDGLKRVAVQGKLTAQGQPLEGAVVQFVPVGSTKGEGGIGRSDKDGRFSLIGSRAGDAGLVPGEYRVRVSRLVGADGTPLPADARDADHPGARESIPARYASLEGSPLKATISDAGGAVHIEIPAPVLGRK